MGQCVYLYLDGEQTPLAVWLRSTGYDSCELVRLGFAPAPARTSWPRFSREQAHAVVRAENRHPDDVKLVFIHLTGFNLMYSAILKRSSLFEALAFAQHFPHVVAVDSHFLTQLYATDPGDHPDMRDALDRAADALEPEHVSLNEASMLAESRALVAELFQHNMNVVCREMRKRPQAPDHVEEDDIFCLDVLREVLEGAVYEVQVPAEHAAAEEFEKFVALFKRYVTRVRGLDLTIEMSTSANLTIYRFRSQRMNAATFVEALDDFQRFLNFLDTAPAQARAIVESSGVAADKQAGLLHAFSLEWQSLKADVEFTVASMVHRWKRQAVSASRGDTLSDIPTDPARLLPGMPLQTPLVINIGGTHVSMGPLINQPDAEELLEVICAHARESDREQLKSYLAVLAAKSVTPEEKQPALSKIRQFLVTQVLPKAGELAFELLSKKVEKMMGL